MHNVHYLMGQMSGLNKYGYSYKFVYFNRYSYFCFMDKKQSLYLQIADNIEHQIKNDVHKIGNKLPSLRTICAEKGVSMNTASQAYLELESRGLIESRPQSGYYVSYSPKHSRKIPQTSQPIVANKEDTPELILDAILQNLR